ncbi:CopD family protein [Halorarius litoreus]|uniref:CopD family protein n=1 Tax=Halorarius litoreus TaxID=2962676 RepID=UPI0020CF86E0|nr:hypothetical protein [Halorarius litoreus]
MVESLHLSVRLLHVLAMAFVTGGAVVLWLGFQRARAANETAVVLSTAVGYEWLFWGAMGLVVATGVGNLGALGAGVEGPGTAWGQTLAVKLFVVLLFFLGSVVRTAIVDGIDRVPVAHNAAIRTLLARSYALTALSLGVVVALAEVLAHG